MKFFIFATFYFFLALAYGLSLKRKIHLPNILKMHSFTEENSLTLKKKERDLPHIDKIEDSQENINHEEQDNPIIILRKNDIEVMKNSIQFLVYFFLRFWVSKLSLKKRLRHLKEKTRNQEL